MFNVVEKTDTAPYSSKEEAVIIDVRTPAEFLSGHIEGSYNFPLDELHNRMNEIKKLSKPVITVCLSGGRSGDSANYLTSEGINARNGGPWASFRN